MSQNDETGRDQHAFTIDARPRGLVPAIARPFSRRILLAGLAASAGLTQAGALERQAPEEAAALLGDHATDRLMHHLRMVALAMDELAADTRWQVYMLGRSPFGERRFMADRFDEAADPEVPGHTVLVPVRILDWQAPRFVEPGGDGILQLRAEAAVEGLREAMAAADPGHWTTKIFWDAGLAVASKRCSI